MYKEIGSRIRMYRKLQGTTLDEMAQRLFKSKSTISKYENGEIVMTIDVLLDIAKLLDVSPEQLIEFPAMPTKRTIALGDGFFDSGLHYVYFTCDCNNRILRGVLDVQAPKDDKISAVYYSTVESFRNYRSCQHLYYGELEPYTNFACFVGNNHPNRSEKILINVSTPFNNDNYARGIICGLSVIFRAPMAFKCIISHQIMEETDKMRNDLLINKDDLQVIKKYNALIRKDIW